MRITDGIKNWEWKVYKQRKRRALKNDCFSILSSNCSGTIMYYDLQLPYTSPTVNLSIGMNDFVKMVKNLRWYMEQEFMQVETGEEYPVGRLGDIYVRFIHYKTFEEAVRKWDERKKRISWDHLFIIGTDRAGCTFETIREFERLPYKNKVIFTHVEYPEFPSSYYIKGFEKEGELGIITDFRNGFLKRRYLDDFDYIRFLNRPYDC